jgi:hypothetical protein
MNLKRLCASASVFALVAFPALADVATSKPQDPNNASYSSATQLTVGGSALSTPTRGIAADCTSGGTATLTMADGTSLSWTVAAGHQNQPYSVKAVASSTATCTFYGLK